MAGVEPRGVAGLAGPERRVLAVLAVVFPAAVSPARLAALADVEDAPYAVAALDRRGLVIGDERGRFTIPPMLLERLRHGRDAADAGEALLVRLVALARARLLSADDLDVVLGAAAWAAGYRRWSSVLRLVRAVRGAIDLLDRRPDAWPELLRRGLQAARAVNDRDAEAWLLEQAAGAAAATGDVASAKRLLRAAMRVRRDLRLAAQGARVRRALWRVADPAGAAGRAAVGALVSAVLALGGLALGLAAFEEDAATGAVATFTIVQTTVGERTATVTVTVERLRTVTARRRRRVVLVTAPEQAPPAAPVSTVSSTVTVPVATTVVVPTTVRVPTTIVVATTVLVPTTVAPTEPAPP